MGPHQLREDKSPFEAPRRRVLPFGIAHSSGGRRSHPARLVSLSRVAQPEGHSASGTSWSWFRPFTSSITGEDQTRVVDSARLAEFGYAGGERRFGVSLRLR